MNVSEGVERENLAALRQWATRGMKLDFYKVSFMIIKYILSRLV